MPFVELPLELLGRIICVFSHYIHQFFSVELLKNMISHDRETAQGRQLRNGVARKPQLSWRCRITICPVGLQLLKIVQKQDGDVAVEVSEPRRPALIDRLHFVEY